MTKEFADRAIVVDGILYEWGDRIGYRPLAGRKAPGGRAVVRRNAFGGHVKNQILPAAKSKDAVRAAFLRTIKKTPEVMLKIKTGGMSLQGIKRRMDYIGRWGAVELEDQAGNLYNGKDEIKSLMEDWQGYGIPAKGGRRKEALHVILSMPPGTPVDGFQNAARHFAGDVFSNHKYAFALHTDDAHPHVHLIVKVMNEDGVRINPRKRDLQLWREQFAEKLRQEGIEANATSRRARGVVRRQERQTTLQIDEQYQQGRRARPSAVTCIREKNAQNEIAGQPLPQPGAEKARAIRKDMTRLYGDVAKALAKGSSSEQNTALQIIDFVKAMPSDRSKHELLVASIRSQGRAGGIDRPSPGRERR